MQVNKKTSINVGTTLYSVKKKRKRGVQVMTQTRCVHSGYFTALDLHFQVQHPTKKHAKYLYPSLPSHQQLHIYRRGSTHENTKKIQKKVWLSFFIHVIEQKACSRLIKTRRRTSSMSASGSSKAMRTGGTRCWASNSRCFRSSKADSSTICKQSKKRCHKTHTHLHIHNEGHTNSSIYNNVVPLRKAILYSAQYDGA